MPPPTIMELSRVLDRFCGQICDACDSVTPYRVAPGTHGVSLRVRPKALQGPFGENIDDGLDRRLARLVDEGTYRVASRTEGPEASTVHIEVEDVRAGVKIHVLTEASE